MEDLKEAYGACDVDRKNDIIAHWHSTRGTVRCVRALYQPAEGMSALNAHTHGLVLAGMSVLAKENTILLDWDSSSSCHAYADGAQHALSG